MMYSDFTQAFQNRIHELFYKIGIDLALSVCKELYWDYVRFVDIEKWGDKKLLLDVIQLCEKSEFTERELKALRNKLKEVDSITPDTENFGSYLGSYALNAAASVYETIQFVLNGDTQHLFNIGTYYTDTIDFKIHESEQLTEEEIDCHPAMLEARAFLLNHYSQRKDSGIFRIANPGVSPGNLGNPKEHRINNS